MGGRVAALLFIVVVGLAAAPAWGAEEMKEEEGKVEYKEVTGTVSAVSKQGIAVEYSSTGQGSYEMFLPVDERVRFARVRGLSELKPGDSVKVRYQQTHKEAEDGKPVILRTLATEVALVRRASEQALISREEESEDE